MEAGGGWRGVSDTRLHNTEQKLSGVFHTRSVNDMWGRRLVFEQGFLCSQGLGNRWVAPVDQRLVIAGTMEFSAADHPKVFIIISLSLYICI